ncbi:hypothetical protein GP475_06910 [Corynebacterium poyangense]|uniref:Ascorbate-specific PTS system EIIA component n=1 Tax=Corynebacterium poyangense TaxID=2684405 RepID=A0A7H0SPB7_9CORY|nr:PTS sugar transporter subunit IIA [Corynebacterium poyangense]MBZ8177968.1 PTS transporter subunit EIIA [Corynebacterium poyangense]QNQ90392.1 hypothetical protein GP475_06910 [Corynebacterium poyangense]
MAELALPLHRIVVGSHTEWSHAVRSCLSLLEKDGLITSTYSNAVITSIKSGEGLYMDLGYEVLLAHTRPEQGSLGVGLALTVLDSPVLLNGDQRHPIRQIWGLCALDSHSHQELMANFAKVLMNEAIRQKISQATSATEIHDLISQA